MDGRVQPCVILLMILLQEYRHPYLAHDELSVLRVLEASDPVSTKREGWPDHEFRGTVRFEVLEVLQGPGKAGERLTLPRIEYRLRGSDRPTTPWEDLELRVGMRILYSPGKEAPSVLDEIASPGEPGAPRTVDLEDVRVVLRLKRLPPPELGQALRELVSRPLRSGAIAAAARDLFRHHPETAANVDAVLGLVLRKDLPHADRRSWAWLLNDMSRPAEPWTSEGNRRLCGAWWRLLDRGLPPAGEDPRVVLHAVTALGDFLWAPGVKPPSAVDFVPAACSKERILQALDYVRRVDTTVYMEETKRLPEHPSLGRLRRYLGP